MKILNKGKIRCSYQLGTYLISFEGWTLDFENETFYGIDEVILEVMKQLVEDDSNQKYIAYNKFIGGKHSGMAMEEQETKE